MNYHTCLNYLENLGNEYLTMKAGLEKTRILLGELDHPEQAFKSILVAGTNGKGSVSRFLESIVRASYPRCGLYTSPHLLSLLERIQIGGQPVQKDLFARSFSQVVRAMRRCRFKYHPTYFEMLTATAFVAFRAASSQMAVLEVGLGGRLDTTNVVDPEISVITPVTFDHQKFLGYSLREIAGEKAGIMRPGKPVVVSPQVAEARAALESFARHVGAVWVELDPSEIRRKVSPRGSYQFKYRGFAVDLRLLGAHQVENAALALLVAQTLSAEGVSLKAETWATQLEKVQPYGALRPLADNPPTLIDGGHNPQALKAAANFVHRHAPRPRALVLGMMKDKDLASSIPQLADLFEQVIFVPVNSPRSAPVKKLLRLYPRGQGMEDPIEALRTCRASSQFVLVAGSYYLAGEVLERWRAGD